MSKRTLTLTLALGGAISSRAELNVGSDVFRLAPRTIVEVLTLDARTIQLRVATGSLRARLHSLPADETVEVDTSGGAVKLLGPGDYRVRVDTTGARSAVTAHGGTAEVTGTKASF